MPNDAQSVALNALFIKARRQDITLPFDRMMLRLRFARSPQTLTLAGPPRAMKILIVDDSAIVRVRLADLLADYVFDKSGEIEEVINVLKDLQRGSHRQDH